MFNSPALGSSVGVNPAPVPRVTCTTKHFDFLFPIFLSPWLSPWLSSPPLASSLPLWLCLPSSRLPPTPFVSFSSLVYSLLAFLPSSVFAYACSLLDTFVHYSLFCTRKAYALTQLGEEDDDLQRVIVEKHMHTFGRIIVGVVAGLKALSWQGLLATCPQVLTLRAAML